MRLIETVRAPLLVSAWQLCIVIAAFAVVSLPLAFAGCAPPPPKTVAPSITTKTEPPPRGAHAVARDAAGRVGGIEEGRAE
jgi:hypothetical protein